MKGNRGIFVKVNYKNIESLIVLFMIVWMIKKNKDKYVMCRKI